MKKTGGRKSRDTLPLINLDLKVLQFIVFFKTEAMVFKWNC